MDTSLMPTAPPNGPGRTPVIVIFSQRLERWGNETVVGPSLIRAETDVPSEKPSRTRLIWRFPSGEVTGSIVTVDMATGPPRSSWSHWSIGEKPPTRPAVGGAPRKGG